MVAVQLLPPITFHQIPARLLLVTRRVVHKPALTIKSSPLCRLHQNISAAILLLHWRNNNHQLKTLRKWHDLTVQWQYSLFTYSVKPGPLHTKLKNSLTLLWQFNVLPFLRSIKWNWMSFLHLTLSYNTLVCPSTVLENHGSSWYVSQQLDTGMSACQLCNIFHSVFFFISVAPPVHVHNHLIVSAGQKPDWTQLFFCSVRICVHFVWLCATEAIQGDSVDCCPFVWQSYLLVQSRSPSEDLRHRPTSSHTGLYRSYTAEQRPLQCTQAG